MNNQNNIIYLKDAQIYQRNHLILKDVTFEIKGIIHRGRVDQIKNNSSVPDKYLQEVIKKAILANESFIKAVKIKIFKL